ncbi:hypothetical protein P7H22_24350 [Paenibacillus larvae]|nr:hypothetical protein [Paenibacillus larvae]MDT2242833.1 hypothetical protein [Paenibacillus larvae]
MARAAADEGLKVKILDPRSSFGGQVLQGEMLFLDETKDESKHSLVQGRVKKLFDGFKGAKIRKTSEFEAYMTKLVDQIPLEQGVTLGHIDTIASTGDALWTGSNIRLKTVNRTVFTPGIGQTIRTMPLLQAN